MKNMNENDYRKVLAVVKDLGNLYVYRKVAGTYLPLEIELAQQAGLETSDMIREYHQEVKSFWNDPEAVQEIPGNYEPDYYTQEFLERNEFPYLWDGKSKDLMHKENSEEYIFSTDVDRVCSDRNVSRNLFDQFFKLSSEERREIVEKFSEFLSVKQLE